MNVTQLRSPEGDDSIHRTEMLMVVMLERRLGARPGVVHVCSLTALKADIRGAVDVKASLGSYDQAWRKNSCFCNYF